MSSETFDAAWLALREAVDHRSRSAAHASALSHWLEDSTPTIVDLGSGTGSNLRYLAPRLPTPQSWTLIDHDPALLHRVDSPSDGWTVRPVVADLSDAGSEEMGTILGSADIVTASALLDLVSEAWMSGIAEQCAAHGCAALFALSYDGSVEWSGEAHADDSLVLEAVNAHQRGDKGLGHALGPDAGSVAARCFEDLGYRTDVARSPWHLGPGEAELGRALVDGWVSAATAMHPEDEARIRIWGDSRRADLAGGRTTLTVGHLDVLALPPKRGGQRAPSKKGGQPAP